MKYPVQEVSENDILTGLRARELMPKSEDIPDEFIRNPKNPWVKLFNDIFSRGIQVKKYNAKTGIDVDMALRHIWAIMKNRDLMHAMKESACAFLFSEWFHGIDYRLLTDKELEKKQNQKMKKTKKI